MEYDNPILNERESTHGDYSNTALIAQDLKSVVRGHSHRLNNTQAESLDLICTKIARILSGDPNCKDSWDDIAGYANLVGERIGKPEFAGVVVEGQEPETEIGKFQRFSV